MYPIDLIVAILYHVQLRNSDRVNVVFTSEHRYHVADWGRESKVVYSIPEWVNLKRCSVKDHLQYIEERDKVVEEYVNRNYKKINERDLRTWEFWSGGWNNEYYR